MARRVPEPKTASKTEQIPKLYDPKTDKELEAVDLVKHEDKELGEFENQALKLLLEKVKARNHFEIDLEDRATLSHLEERALAKLGEDKELHELEIEVLSLLLERVETKIKEELSQLDEGAQPKLEEGYELYGLDKLVLRLQLDRVERFQKTDLIPDWWLYEETLHDTLSVVATRIVDKHKKNVELDQVERSILRLLIAEIVAKNKEDEELNEVEREILSLSVPVDQCNSEDNEIDFDEDLLIISIAEGPLAKLRKGYELDGFEKEILYDLVDQVEKTNLILDWCPEETLCDTFSVIATWIVYNHKRNVKLDRLERSTLRLLRAEIVAKNKDNEELKEVEREVLSLKVVRIKNERIHDRAKIKEILAKGEKHLYSTGQSIVKNGRKLFIYDSKIMIEVLEYLVEVDDICLSISGKTLVVKYGNFFGIWDLSAKAARFIEDMNDDFFCSERFSVRSCDDEYIAYNNKEEKLIVYHIATRQRQTVSKKWNAHVQIFKGSLYYGYSDTPLTVAKLNDIANTKKKSNKEVVEIIATVDVVIAVVEKKKLGYIVEAWKNDFEVEWYHYGYMKVLGDKVVLTDTDEAVIIDLRSKITTVIAEGIDEIKDKHAEFEPNKITLDGSQVFELKPNWKYWFSLGSGLLYYFDVGTDLVLLDTYFSTELYLIFALSLVLIITPNIVEVIEKEHRTLKSCLAQLLFVEHFLVLVRDYKNPTYLNGSRTTGKELSRRTTIEVGIESIPQSLISLYFIFSTESYTVLPLLSLAISMLSASLATSFGLKLSKSDVFVGCLFCYRFCEILLQVMILALCSTYIFPYFAILFIASNTFIRFLLYIVYMHKTGEFTWLYYLVSSTVNSFAYVNGLPVLKEDFITKGDNSEMGGINLIYSHLINFVLIIILQVVYEVSYILSAFMWALYVMRIVLFVWMHKIERRRILHKIEEDEVVASQKVQ
jgi:hypothetical protein